MAIRVSLFKIPKNRKYEYMPRYYDAEKAELAERLEKAELLAEDSIEGAKARIAHKLSSRSGNGRAFEPQRRKAIMRSNLMLVGIIIGLLLISFFLWDMYTPEILEFLE